MPAMLRIGSVVFFVARTPAMSLAGIWAWPWRPEPPRAGILDNCELSSRGGGLLAGSAHKWGVSQTAVLRWFSMSKWGSAVSA
jgi:hypothetical protein